MMQGDPSTLREMIPGEEPKKGEVTWSIDEPITSDDQYRLAKALLKRLRRGLAVCSRSADNPAKRTKATSKREALEFRIAEVDAALQAWAERNHG